MKKMITLLVATGFITVAFAQNGQYDHRDQQYNNGYQNQQNNGYQNQGNNGYHSQPNTVVVVRDEHHFDDHGMFRERDEQIARINHEFNWKINAVSHRWFMSRDRRDFEIHTLEMQKQHEIGEVYARFNNHGNFRHDGFEQGRHW